MLAMDAKKILVDPMETIAAFVAAAAICPLSAAAIRSAAPGAVWNLAGAGAAANSVMTSGNYPRCVYGRKDS